MLPTIITHRITAAEYSTLPESNLPAHLIDGVIVTCPTPYLSHQAVLADIAMWLHDRLPHGHLLISPVDVHFDSWNVLQPDILWMARHSRCVEVDGRYLNGPPDLVIEILSPFTVHLDHSHKFPMYQQHGVRECWMVNGVTQSVAVFTHDGNQFQHLGTFASSQTFVSPVLDDLTIEVLAFFQDE
jgi:Uma2 family endonuclease